jgi:FMN phosphatase YigB (HAD superfamily)
MPYDVVRKVFQKANSELQSARRSLSLLGIPIEDGKLFVQEALENANIAKALKEDKRLCYMMSNIVDKYHVYLITSSSKDQTKKKLNALGLETKLFYPLLDSDAKYLRDDGQAFTHVSAILNVPLADMMFVGDREKVDIIPGANLGMLTAIVNAKSDIANFQLSTIYELEKILS